MKILIKASCDNSDLGWAQYALVELDVKRQREILERRELYQMVAGKSAVGVTVAAMTRENAILINTIREICGQAPIPCKGQVKGKRVDYEPDRQRFIANLAQFAGDGNRQATRRAGAL